MGNQFDEFDEFEDLDEYTGNDLVKKLRQQLSAAQKQLREQTTLVQELTTFQHQQTVSQMLASYNLNPNIARYIPDDVVSEEDLNEWLDEYGADFGIEAGDSDPYAGDPDAQAAALMNSVDDYGYDPEVGYDDITQMEQANSAEEVLRLARGF